RSVLGLLLAIAIPVVAATALYVGTRPTCACEPIPASPVDGIVVQVDATGLTEISGFDLRTPRYPVNLHFVLGPLENATEFSPGHLKSHQASASPVRVYYVRSGQDLVLYRLEDAPVDASSP
ncbi:MAG TPA: hypothetical protein VF484_08525, partial [Candidatus Limnocylindrales bacterium]